MRACGGETVASVAVMVCNNSTGGSPKKWHGGGVMVVMMVRAVMAVMAVMVKVVAIEVIGLLFGSGGGSIGAACVGEEQLP